MGSPNIATQLYWVSSRFAETGFAETHFAESSLREIMP